MKRFLMGLCVLPSLTSAAVTTGTDESAQLPFWEWTSEGMSIRWVQRLPDQSRAFFAARQFNANDVERIANSCVFQTVYKNIEVDKSSAVIEYNLADWQVIQKGKTKNLKLKESWLAEWQNRNVSAAAKIAFEWSLLPSKHRLQAGDYNWGMTTFGLKPGERFDLKIVWQRNGVSKTAMIPNVECAKDLHLEPTTDVSE